MTSEQFHSPFKFYRHQPRTLYLSAAMTGLRQGELIALSWQDIDWLAGLIREPGATRVRFGW